MKTIQEYRDSNVYNERLEVVITTSNDIINDKFIGSNIDITDTPIPVTMFDNDSNDVYFSVSASKEYNDLVSKINSLGESSKEYSFLLIGKSINSDDGTYYIIDYLLDISGSNLSNRLTSVDINKLQAYIEWAISNNYDLISIGHTHPLISDDEKKTTIAKYMDSEFKEYNDIREPGLNLSLQDLISYDSLHEQINNIYPNKFKHILDTIIMFNGEICMIEKDSNFYKRFTNMYVTSLNKDNEIDYDKVEVLEKKESVVKK